jgi:hypothetical protein
MVITDGGPSHPEVFHSIWNRGAHQDIGYYYFDVSDLDEEVNFRLAYHFDRLQANFGGAPGVGHGRLEHCRRNLG